MNRAFKGIWIPKEIWLSKELSLQEKIFLAEIDSLDNSNGCFASNKYFADFFGLSKNRCSEVIKSLEKKGLISIDYIREEGQKNIKKRVIRVFDKPNRGVREIDRPIRKTEEGYSEKLEENNTVINNTVNNPLEQQLQHKGSAEIVQFWDNNGFGYNNINAKEKLLSWLENSKFKNPKEMILKALDIATSNNARRLSYVEGVLRNWQNESLLTVEEVENNNKKSKKSDFRYDPNVDSF